jgi:surfeit locus 1 family protein
LSRSNITTVPQRAASIAPAETARARLRGLIVPAFVVLAAFAVLVSLGNWQVRRLAWKEDLIARVAERPHDAVRTLPSAADWASVDVEEGEYRPYRLTGRFLHDKEALVFTSLPDAKGPFGGPGFWVVTPFALSGGGTVLVNRGFAPQGRHLPADRGESREGAPVSVSGLMRPDEKRGWLTPADRPDANVFYARNSADLSAAKGLSAPIAPFTIDLLAGETPPGGLPQAGETRMVFTNNHLQYAVTWYGLAAALLAVFALYVRGRFAKGDKKHA